jgi:hypothetical protein
MTARIRLIEEVTRLATAQGVSREWEIFKRNAFVDISILSETPGVLATEIERLDLLPRGLIRVVRSAWKEYIR